MIVLTTSVLAKACGCSAKEYLFKLLNLLPPSSFLALSLRTFLNRMNSCSLPSSKIILFFKDVIRIMNELLLKFPNCYDSLPVAELYCGVIAFADAGNLDEHQMDKNSLRKDAEELFQLRNQKIAELKKREEEKQPRRRRGRDCKTYFEKISVIFSRCCWRLLCCRAPALSSSPSPSPVPFSSPCHSPSQPSVFPARKNAPKSCDLFHQLLLLLLNQLVFVFKYIKLGLLIS